MAGRPSKRTPEREARLLEALRAGNTRKDASLYAGLEQHTFQRWVLADAHFAQAVEKAEADAVVRNVAQIAKAAQEGTWQAAAWWLERRRPEDYGRRDRVEITLRQEAHRIAADLGIDVNELLAEADRIVAGAR